MHSQELQLIKVMPNRPEHIQFLYDLLSQRPHGISHKSMPSVEKHQLFVSNHPYREWFIVEKDNKSIGAIYLQHDNSVGVNFMQAHYEQIPQALTLVCDTYSPLEGLASVRSPYFHVHVATADKALHEILLHMQAVKIQTTFTLPKD